MIGKRLAGWTPGIHLSERGRKEAEGLAERLAGLQLRGLYASPLERCLETAEPLASRYRLEVRVSEDLGEIRVGAWTGRPLAQLARTKLWRRVQWAPSTFRFPSGESFLEVQERAVRGVGEILASQGQGAVALVSHGDVIRLLLAHFAGVHVDLFQRLVVDPASVSAVMVGDGLPRLLRVNDTGRMDDLGPRPARRKVRG